MSNPEEGRKERLGYRNLEVWKVSRALAIDVTKMAASGRWGRLRGLADQMQRSAVSVPSNIAEGEEKGGNRDALKFLHIAKGSLAELRAQIDIAHACEGLTLAEFEDLDSRCHHATALLSGTIRRRQSYENGREPR